MGLKVEFSKKYISSEPNGLFPIPDLWGMLNGNAWKALKIDFSFSLLRIWLVLLVFLKMCPGKEYCQRNRFEMLVTSYRINGYSRCTHFWKMDESIKHLNAEIRALLEWHCLIGSTQWSFISFTTWWGNLRGLRTWKPRFNDVQIIYHAYDTTI